GFLYTVSTSDVVIDIFISPEITKEDVISFLWENLGRIIQLEHSRDGYLKYVPAKIAQKKIFGSTNEIIAELNNDYSYFKENKLSRGYLLIGKPGTGKSAVVNSIIKNTEGSVFIINGLDTVESVEEMTSLFTQMRPDFIVFDDCDRSFDEPHFIKVVLGMLETIKEHNPCTNFLFTANTFSGILQDEAVTRKGRIDQIFEIPEPNEDDRREIFKGYIKDMGLDIPSEDFEKCIEFSDGLTGADIKELCIQLQRSTIDDVFERFKEIENLREKYSKDETSDLSILKKIAALADRED
ncbi:MAG: AAA family ATPase, partial [Candidatus Thorarchaeota archaeon]